MSPATTLAGGKGARNRWTRNRWTTNRWAARAAWLAAGLAAGLAHPPFGLIVGLLGYAVLLRGLDGAVTLRSAFARGWIAGVGYFAVSIWWIVEPFMVDAKTQGWMAPFALLLMAAGLALFWGLAGLAYRLAVGRGRVLSFARVLVFAGCLAAAEWLRGHVLTGFPWNLPGESWRAGSAPSQAAAVVGAYGLTWLTLALASAPALLVDARPRAQRIAMGVAIAATLAGLYGFGAWRLSRADTTPLADAPVIRIVQANIDQKDKWRPENLDLIFDTYLDLSTRPRDPGVGAPDIIVWPEGALPAVINDLLVPGSPYAGRLAAALTPGQTLLMGANRADLGPGGQVRYFNSLVALQRAPGEMRWAGAYDKHRLVPFGEFLPLGGLATRIGLRSLVHMPEDFSAGAPPRPMTLPGVPTFQPLICYEALFPGFTRQAERRAGRRAAFILNVSNDAWFGMTSGPLQHLNMAGYRAIEQGLPIFRATPTGVSAHIDAFGRTPKGLRIGLGETRTLDSKLSRPALPTPYGRLGDLPLLAMMLASVVAILVQRIQPPAVA